VQWRFRAGVEKQFIALQKGFHELIPPHLLKMFDEKELELIISGLGKVDVEDWKANTRLKHCTPDTDVVKWFWKVCVGGRLKGLLSDSLLQNINISEPTAYGHTLHQE